VRRVIYLGVKVVILLHPVVIIVILLDSALREVSVGDKVAGA
jgi:hypothetical protein